MPAPPTPRPLRWIDAEACQAEGALSGLDLLSAIARAGRMLPLDPPEADTSCAAMALGVPPGPRTRAYGAARDWLLAVAMVDGRSLDAGGLAALEPAPPPSAIRGVTWRTMPSPPARRVLRADFPSAMAMAEALATLGRQAGPELVAAELGDPSIGAWLSGPGRRRPCVLHVALEGDVEPVARASRRVWQVLELAGGAPEALSGRHRLWGPVHPPAPAEVVRVSFELGPEDLPPWIDAIAGIGQAGGAMAFRAHALGAILHVYLPPAPTRPAVVAWLEREASAMGARPLAVG